MEKTNSYRVCFLLVVCLWGMFFVDFRGFRKLHSQSSISRGKKYFIYKMGGSGLGSQLLNMFSKAIYMSEAFNRSMIVDESHFDYRRNDSVGVFTGYFTPKFPVFDRVEQHSYVESITSGLIIHLFASNYRDPYPSLNTEDKSIWITGLHDYRPDIFLNYNVSSMEFFEKMGQALCPHMKLNEETLTEVHDLKNLHGFPSFREDSVAFHVRRTDKLEMESRLYRGEEYVAKLLAVAKNEDFKYCFVATDDWHAVDEIRLALEASNIFCKVYALNHQDVLINRVPAFPETLRFITELSMLIDAKYFVGTFNSNIGALVSLMRSCKYPNIEHYSRSYGVDTDTWYMW
jgi:hypothetical protein